MGNSNSAMRERATGNQYVGRSDSSSCSPALKCALTFTLLASVQVLAMTMTGSAALGGSCSEGATGVFTYSGPASASDTSQKLYGTAGNDLVVTTTDNFGMSTSSGYSIKLYGRTGSGDLSYRDDFSSSIASSGNGIDGFHASQFGTGSLDVLLTGDVSSRNLHGIHIETGSTATSATITTGAGTITGKDQAIVAQLRGTGAVTLKTGGAVISGNANDGIYIRSTNTNATSMNIDLGGDVSGGVDGLDAYHVGSQSLSVITDATVTGGSGWGIKTGTGAGGLTNITLNSGADVSSTSGNGIFNDAGDSVIQVKDGAKVSGAVRLGDGSDKLTLTTASDISDMTIIDGGDDVSASDGFVDTLTFQQMTVTATGANINNWENVVLDGGKVVFGDGTLIVGGDTGNGLSVINSGELDAGMAFALTGNLSLDSGGVFDGTGGGAGVYNINGDVSNNSVVSTQDGAAGDTIIVTGDYSGTGKVKLDAELGDSSSKSDQLMIKGNSSGATKVSVVNSGGSGGLTGTGSTDGIELVHVEGTSSGSFALEQPVWAGAYAYDLVQADGQNWYLQSTLQGQVYGYSAIQAILQGGADGSADDHGTLLNADGSQSSSGSGFWIGGGGSSTSAEGKTTVGNSSVRTNLDYSGGKIKLGYDHKVYENEHGKLILGGFGRYKHLDVKIDDADGNRLADGKSDGYGGGGSLTWLSTSGLYGSLFGQVTSWKNKIDGAGGVSASFDAMAYSASAKSGYRIHLNEYVQLIPQALLVWQRNDFDKLTDSNGVAVSWNEKDALTGRVSMVLKGKVPVFENNAMITGYAISHLIRDFSSAGSLTASGTRVTTQTSRTRIDSRLGAHISNKYIPFKLFAEVGMVNGLGHKDYTSYKGRVGAGWKF